MKFFRFLPLVAIAIVALTFFVASRTHKFSAERSLLAGPPIPMCPSANCDPTAGPK